MLSFHACEVASVLVHPSSFVRVVGALDEPIGFSSVTYAVLWRLCSLTLIQGGEGACMPLSDPWDCAARGVVSIAC